MRLLYSFVLLLSPHFDTQKITDQWLCKYQTTYVIQSGYANRTLKSVAYSFLTRPQENPVESGL